MEERIISAQRRNEDDLQDSSLRPRSLDDFIGQEKLKDNLSV